MIYYTGDIHGVPWKICQFCKKIKPTADDVIVILGDIGANFYGDERDNFCKYHLNRFAPSIFCIHGNHEIRPEHIPSYQKKVWSGGEVWYEPEYPNILFAKDGEIYTIEGLRHIVIGGAYSVDKEFRLAHGTGWWSDEQPSEEIKRYVESQLSKYPIDIVLSHTCPFRYEPTEMFLPYIEQNAVDDSTERWLDEIEAKLEYRAWFCGHWHTDKRIAKMHFLYKTFETSEFLLQQEEG